MAPIISTKGPNTNLKGTNLSYNSGHSAPRAPTVLRGTQYKLSSLLSCLPRAHMQLGASRWEVPGHF